MPWRFLKPFLLIVVPMAAGYLGRRRGLVSERLAKGLMTFVAVFGYPSVGFFSIWRMDLQATDLWLPVLAAGHVTVLTGIGLLFGRAVAEDRPGAGLIALCAGMGNTGFTMGALVIYVLFGEQGLGLASIYCLMWTPMVVLLTYPVTRHHAPGEPNRPLGRLLLRSLFDWRSIGLPVSLTAIGLSLKRVPSPGFLDVVPVIDILIIVVTAAAFFGIGLRLHLAQFRPSLRYVAAATVGRFGIAPAVAWATVSLTAWIGGPLAPRGLARDVYMIESFVPTAVTMVGVANMFGVKPRVASLVFVVTTLTYLIVILPFVLWFYG